MLGYATFENRVRSALIDKSRRQLSVGDDKSQFLKIFGSLGKKTQSKQNQIK